MPAVSLMQLKSGALNHNYYFIITITTTHLIPSGENTWFTPTHPKYTPPTPNVQNSPGCRAGRPWNPLQKTAAPERERETQTIQAFNQPAPWMPTRYHWCEHSAHKFQIKSYCMKNTFDTYRKWRKLYRNG